MPTCGVKDAGLLETLAGRHTEYTAIESSHEMMREFTNNVVKNEKFSGIDFRLHTMTCEEFLKRTPSQKYDVVHFVHTMYCIDQMDKVIHDYMEIVAPNGLMVIIHEAKDGLIQRERAKLGNGPRGSRDIPATLNSLGLCYTVENYTSVLEITSIFQEEGREEDEGALLLDFLAYAYKFRENYPASAVTCLLNNISSAAVKQGKKLMIEKPMEAFLITPGQVLDPE